MRAWNGEITDGMTLNGERVSGVNRVVGAKLEKLAKAVVGDVVALGRLDGAHTGALLAAPGKPAEAFAWPEPLKPMFAQAVHARERSDEVKLTSALARLVDEDPSLSYGHDPDTQEFLLWGQGEMQIAIALDRLRNRFNIRWRRSARRCPTRRPSAARSATMPGTRSSRRPRRVRRRAYRHQAAAARLGLRLCRHRHRRCDPSNTSRPSKPACASIWPAARSAFRWSNPSP